MGSESMDIIAYLAENKNIHLNEQQKQGVLSYGQNTLLLAVPGSGKTTVLVSRIADLLLNRGIPAERILTLTFNRETAGDMSRRFASLFGGLTDQRPRFSTIHSFCLSVLRFYGQALNRPLPTLLTEEYAAQKRAALREIYRKRLGEYPADDVFEELERRIGYAKNMLLTEEELREADFAIDRFATLFADYEAFKRKNRLMDFDDMLTLTLDIFQKFPAILSRFQERYDEINVDEAQDTSLVQHQILTLLAKKAHMFMVGDEDQSIYSFRGAYPKALLAFRENYPSARLLKMEQNYRCPERIVQTADRFIRQNKQRYEKTMVCPTKKPGEIELIALRDYAAQYEQAFRILSALPEGKTAAVLYRNNESAIPLIDLFYRSEKRYASKEPKLSYFDSMVIRDLTAYLRLAADPADLEAFSQIYYKLGYSKGIYAYAVEHTAESGNVFECIAGLPMLKKWQQMRTRDYKSRFAGLRLMRPAQAIDVIEKDLNYDSFIERRMSDGAIKTQTYQKLNAAKCLAEGLRTIYDFLEKLSAMRTAMEERRQIDPTSPVLLSTLHSAKGMEFDVVILLDALQNILPDGGAVKAKREGDPDDYENEVRLFYVGVTRAREKLILFTGSRMNGADAAPSVFVSDLLNGPPQPKPMPGQGRTADGRRLPALVGKTVVHSLFDEGRVLSQEGDMIQVEFKMFGRKKLNLAVCLENGFLQIRG